MSSFRMSRWTAMVAGGVLAAAGSNALAVPVTSNLILWLDADAAQTNPGAGNVVSTWSDKPSGTANLTANNAAQSVVTKRPVWTDNVTPAGTPVVHFDGVDDFLDVPHAADFDPGAGGLSFFAVVRHPSVNDVGSILNKGATSSSVQGYNLFRSTTGDGRYYFYVNGDSGADIHAEMFLAEADNEFVILSGVIDAGTIAADRINNVGNNPSTAAFTPGDATYTGSVSSAAATRIGAFSNGGNPFEGDIAEILIYNTALSSTDVDAVQNYLFERHLLVPEPGSTTIAALGGLLMLTRRRQRCKPTARADGGWLTD